MDSKKPNGPGFRAFHLLPVAALVALGISACGSGNSPSSSTTPTPPTSPSTMQSGAGAGARTAVTKADPSGALAFIPSALSVAAGQDVVIFTNNSPVAHGLTLVDSSGATVGSIPVFSSGKKTLQVQLKPGNYTFFCQVPGHQQAGMAGTLTVK